MFRLYGVIIGVILEGVKRMTLKKASKKSSTVATTDICNFLKEFNSLTPLYFFLRKLSVLRKERIVNIFIRSEILQVPVAALSKA